MCGGSIGGARTAPGRRRRRRRSGPRSWPQYELQGHPYYASARLWDDGVVDPLQTRMCLALGYRRRLNAPMSRPVSPCFAFDGAARRISVASSEPAKGNGADDDAGFQTLQTEVRDGVAFVTMVRRIKKNNACLLRNYALLLLLLFAACTAPCVLCCLLCCACLACCLRNALCCAPHACGPGLVLLAFACEFCRPCPRVCFLLLPAAMRSTSR